MSCEWDVYWNRDYDSTWDDEENEILEPDPTRTFKWGASWSASAARDMQNYRRGYPGKEEPNNDEMLNLKFYKNEIMFEPNGVYIDDILADWQGQYDQLERNHSYIQWLFPLQEMGMNWCAKPLTQQEIEALKSDENAKRRFCEAYRLMLDFYGIKLKDEKTGEVVRSNNYIERFNNLNRHGHNNLRITRILKCLGELGYEHFQAPLVQFFLEETLVNKKLPNVKRSTLDYFMFTVKDRKQRKDLVLYAWEKLEDKGRFIWGPHRYLRKRTKKSTDSSINKDNTEDEESKISEEVKVERNNVANIAAASVSGTESATEEQLGDNEKEEKSKSEERSENVTEIILKKDKADEREQVTGESSSDKNKQKELPHTSETKGVDEDEGNSEIRDVSEGKSEIQQTGIETKHTMEKKENSKSEERSENVTEIILKKDQADEREQVVTGESSLDKHTQKELPDTSETEGVDEGNSEIRDLSEEKSEIQQAGIETEHTVEKKEKSKGEERSENVTEIILKKDKADERDQEVTGESSLDKYTQKELPHTSETEGVDEDEGNLEIRDLSEGKSEIQQTCIETKHTVEKKENSKSEERSENVTEIILKKDQADEREQEVTGESSLDKNTQKELPDTSETEGVDEGNSEIRDLSEEKSEIQQAGIETEHTVKKKEKSKGEELSENVTGIILKKDKADEREQVTGESSLDNNKQKELQHTSETEGVDEDEGNSEIRDLSEEKSEIQQAGIETKHTVEKKEKSKGEERLENVTEIILKKDKADEREQVTGESSLDTNTQKVLPHIPETEVNDKPMSE